MGIIDDPLSCPCGTATGLYVTYDYWREHPVPDLPITHELPEAVKEFTRAFDSYQLPQYALPDE